MSVRMLSEIRVFPDTHSFRRYDDINRQAEFQLGHVG
jgi:hypothetical protein